MKTRGFRTICRTAMTLALASALALLPATTAQASVRVRATGSQTFRPKRLEVGVGTRVVWKSTSGTHTVTAYSSNWSKNSQIDTGETTAFRFGDAGRYRYRCILHSSLLSDGTCSGMCGKVIVT